MTAWQVAGVAWLVLSVFLAPVVGRMIHDPRQCRVCERRRLERAYVAARGRHPARAEWPR